MKYQTALLSTAISAFGTSSALAHPGDHGGGLLEVISHFLVSPWHLLGLFFVIAFTLGLFFLAVKKHKAE